MEKSRNNNTKTSNKTKATDEISSVEAKKPRTDEKQYDAVDMNDPLFAMSTQEIRQSLSDWVDACDPKFQEERYGNGPCPSVTKNLLNSHMVASCAEYYRDKRADLLVKDKAPCDGICNLHILHVVARLWSWRPNICYGSFEIQVLSYVLKDTIKRNNLDNEKAGALLIRLLDIAHAYSSDYKKKDSVMVNGIQKEEPRLWRVPTNQHAAVAIFFYPNLQFLYKRKDDEYEAYQFASSDIKRDVESFTDALIQICDGFAIGVNAYQWFHTVPATKALEYAIKKCDKSLQKRHRPLELHDTPLTVNKVTAYDVKF